MNKEYIKSLKGILKSTKNQVQKNRVRLAILNVTGNKDDKGKVKKGNIKKHKRTNDSKARENKKKGNLDTSKEKRNIRKESTTNPSDRNFFLKSKEKSQEKVVKISK